MRLQTQNNTCCPESLPQQRKWCLAAPAPGRCNHEAEHPAESSDKTCAGNMMGLPSPNSHWRCIFLSLLAIFAVLHVNSQNTYKAFY